MRGLKREYYAQYLMSMVGGFFGAYAILNFHNSFGSAQTANMIYLTMDLIGRNLGDYIIRVLACLIYISGIVIAVVLGKVNKVNLRKCSLVLDIIAIIFMVLLPVHKNDLITLYPIFFVTAFQWCSFNGVDGYVSSTVFSTNNLRQFVTAGTDYMIGKKRQDYMKMKFFGLVLLFYHIGVGISFLSYIAWGRKGIIVCVIPIMITLPLLHRKRHDTQDATKEVA